MDKPNVIYAAAYDPSLERGFLTCSTVPMKHDDVKYIRKDTLLEWVKGEIMPGNSAEGKGWNLALQTLIEKLESL